MPKMKEWSFLNVIYAADCQIFCLQYERQVNNRQLAKGSIRQPLRTFSEWLSTAIVLVCHQSGQQAGLAQDITRQPQLCSVSLDNKQDIIRQPQLSVSDCPLPSVWTTGWTSPDNLSFQWVTAQCHGVSVSSVWATDRTSPVNHSCSEWLFTATSVLSVWTSGRTSPDNPSCQWVTVHCHQCAISLDNGQDITWQPQLSVNDCPLS